jgi:cell shape-determining protein MreC
MEDNKQTKNKNKNASTKHIMKGSQLEVETLREENTRIKATLKHEQEHRHVSYVREETESQRDERERREERAYNDF